MFSVNVILMLLNKISPFSQNKITSKFYKCNADKINSNEKIRNIKLYF